jgi:hypothetical protein
MIGRSTGSLFVVGLALVVGVVHAAEVAPSRGAELLAPFKRELKAALKAGLAKGPVEALSACNLRAPEIAASLSHDGVRIGRSSHRLRNPANAPSDWVRPLLDAYVADPSQRAPQEVALADGRNGYVEPIFVQPLCLTCHGEALAPDVAARIEALYPEDRAVGFREGDFRGVFWVEFPTE